MEEDRLHVLLEGGVQYIRQVVRSWEQSRHQCLSVYVDLLIIIGSRHDMSHLRILHKTEFTNNCRAQVQVQVRSRSGPGQKGQKLT